MSQTRKSIIVNKFLEERNREVYETNSEELGKLYDTYIDFVVREAMNYNDFLNDQGAAKFIGSNKISNPKLGDDRWMALVKDSTISFFDKTIKKQVSQDIVFKYTVFNFIHSVWRYMDGELQRLNKDKEKKNNELIKEAHEVFGKGSDKDDNVQS